MINFIHTTKPNNLVLPAMPVSNHPIAYSLPAISSVEVAFVPCVKKRKTNNRPLLEILEDIKKGEWKTQIEALRNIPRTDEKAYSDAKTKLPAFMISMSSKGGLKASDIQTHSGFLQIDIDKIGATEASGLRDAMATDEHVVAAWISPSGDGLKAIIRIPKNAKTHQDSFAAAEAYIKTKYSFDIDASCKNVNRNCFVGYDPDLIFNYNAKELPVNPVSKGKIKNVNAKGKASLSPAGAIASWQNDPLFQKNKKLANLYQLHVFSFGAPMNGNRNQKIIDICTLLYYVVKPDYIFDFIKIYYNGNKSAFAGYSWSKIEYEIYKQLNNCGLSFFNKLPYLKQRAYLNLDEETQAAFRICHSLSQCTSDLTVPPPRFHLSCDHLGTRLGVNAMRAKRIIRNLQDLEIINLVQKGTLYQAGQKAQASIYKWTEE